MQASDHRANARAALAGNWLMAVLVAFLANLISGSGGFEFKFNLNGSGDLVSFTVPQELESVLGGILGISAALLFIIALALTVVGLILGGVMQLGSARYNLNLIDRSNPELNDLFRHFDRFGPALVMNLLTSLFVALGTLLFIVPGIILSYSYALAPYILAEDPNCSGWEAMQRSSAMMRGHKGELFWLDLTFIGWTILATITFGIGYLFLNPYTAAARASFYRDLQNQGYATVE